MSFDKVLAISMLSTSIIGVSYLGYEYQKMQKEHELAVSSMSIAPPSMFEVSEVGHNWARLTWQYQNPKNIQGYSIYRNNTLISKTSKNRNSFTDLHLKGDQSYTYKIIANSQGKQSSAKHLSLTTKTNLAPRFSYERLNVKIGSKSMGSAVHNLEASDPNKDKLYYSLEGEDSSLFLVNEVTGEIIIRKDLMPSKQYKLRACVSDGFKKDIANIVINT